MSLDNYIYISKNFVNQYFAQMPNKHRAKSRFSLSNLTLGLNGASLSLNSGGNDSAVDSYSKVLLLNDYLEKENLVSRSRPAELHEEWRANSEAVLERSTEELVLERFTAKKVIIPTGEKFPFPNITAVVVWISDPDPGLYVDDDFVWKGTFLYLLETIYDDHHSTHMMSGVSALQALSNILTGKKFFELPKPPGEPLGRWDYQHPVKKLEKLGGFVSDERKLASLYKKRYMTDEQSYEYKGKQRRVNDLLAYPVWIREDA